MTEGSRPGRAAFRALTDDEQDLLAACLSADFDGVEALRAQARQALASPGCTFGCGTIDLHVPHAPRSSASSPLPVEGEVVGPGGEPIGGLLVFLDDGRLAGLEVYSFGDPLPLPPADQVRWYG